MVLHFDNFYFLGDSLSDTDNVLNLTGGALPNPPLYTPGRFSNGDIWVDSLADKFNLNISPSTNIQSNNDGVNFAIGGSTSGAINNNPLFPSFAQQMDALESLVQNQSSEEVVNDDLFLLWIGADDYLNLIDDNPETPDIIENNLPDTAQETEALINEVNTNISEAIQDIIELGGENIFVFNLPDLSLTPLGMSLDIQSRKKLSELSTENNDHLLDTIGSIPLFDTHVFCTLSSA